MAKQHIARLDFVLVMGWEVPAPLPERSVVYWGPDSCMLGACLILCGRNVSTIRYAAVNYGASSVFRKNLRPKLRRRNVCAPA